jgi:hypothetical protein
VIGVRVGDLPGEGGHDERSGRADRDAQALHHSRGAAFDVAETGQGGVHDQGAALLDADSAPPSTSSAAVSEPGGDCVVCMAGVSLVVVRQCV